MNNLSCLFSYILVLFSTFIVLSEARFYLPNEGSDFARRISTRSDATPPVFVLDADYGILPSSESDENVYSMSSLPSASYIYRGPSRKMFAWDPQRNF